MKYTLITLLSILLTSLVCCKTNTNKIEASFDGEFNEASIGEFEINEILKPIDMALNDRYICILNEETAKDEQIYVFDADNLKFLYKFAKKGIGPDETLALDMVKTFRGDTLDIIDQANYKKYTYLLTPDSAKILEREHIDVPQMGPLQEVYWVNDSVLIFNSDLGNLITYNDNQNKIIDEMNITSFIEDMDEDMIRKFGTFHFSLIGNDVVIGLRNFNEIFKIKLTDNYHFNVCQIVPISAKNIISDNIYKNYVYYAFIDAKKDHILAQYYGRKLQDMQKFPLNINGQILKYDILLFDKNLNIDKKYSLDFDILRTFLDEKRKRIYFLEASEDFNKMKYIQF